MVSYIGQPHVALSNRSLEETLRDSSLSEASLASSEAVTVPPNNAGHTFVRPASLTRVSSKPAGKDEPAPTFAATLDDVPNHVLTEILSLCDGPTLDSAALVSRRFSQSAFQARILIVQESARDPRRISQEIVPSRMDLFDMGYPHPNFSRVLASVQSKNWPKNQAEGPLMETLQASARLEDARAAARKYGGLRRREVPVTSVSEAGTVTKIFTEIGECKPVEDGNWSTTSGHAIRFLDDDPAVRYEGAFEDGKKHGFGYETFDDHSRHEGMYQFDLANGYGTRISDSQGRMTGNFKDGNPHGETFVELTEGDTIAGICEEGDLKTGTFISPSGYRYSGHFKEQVPHGHGEMSDTTGEFRHYVGNFEDGKLSGRGVAIDQDGIRYDGQFWDNEFVGPGNVTTTDGEVLQIPSPR